jgi:heme/copper-type cytochrome/quinol oxidase subunit 2
MSDDDDEKPLDPAAARAVAQVRRLMMIASATTLVAVAVVVGVIGYRVFKAEGSGTDPMRESVRLPHGARIVSTAVAEVRIVVTIELNSGLEIYTFDLKTLKPTGRLNFINEP